MIAAACVHYWLIASPEEGSHVAGRCRDCGEERMFRAAIPADYSWMDGSYPSIVCLGCGIEKPPSEFRMRQDRRKRVNRCKACEAA